MPCLPILSDSDIRTAFVPGYSGGSATVLHRFPITSVDEYSLLKNYWQQKYHLMGQNYSFLIPQHPITLLAILIEYEYCAGNIYKDTEDIAMQLDNVADVPEPALRLTGEEIIFTGSIKRQISTGKL